LEIDLDIAANHPAQLLEPLPERSGAELSFGIALGVEHQHADPPHALSLLRVRRERPRSSGAAEKRDELAPFHQQFLPCFEAEDRTAGGLLHCGISKEPLSAVGYERPKRDCPC